MQRTGPNSSSQNNQRFVANFGRRTIVPLQSAATPGHQNVIVIGGGVNGDLQFAQLPAHQVQVQSQPREGSTQQLKSNIFIDQNFSNFVSLQQPVQKGGTESATGQLQMPGQAQGSGIQSFRIGSQEKGLQQNERVASSGGIQVRQQKQVCLPFIQTPKQQHAGMPPQKGIQVNGKQQLLDDQLNYFSLFKDV
jgi:hypothetical protein